jgi:hypothetical protein
MRTSPSRQPLRRAHRSGTIDPSSGPVVVGGVGGSGTRVVAEIMQHLGIHMGSDLNQASDNWWFTLLGKLPRWDLAAALEPGSQTLRSFEVLEQAMTGRLGPTRDERHLIAEVVERCSNWWRHDPLPDDRPPDWLRARAEAVLHSHGEQHRDARMWGWKEPNSHLFIEHLHLAFGDRLRYVHVIRNGLHMATSKNQHQVRRWGSLFDVVVGAEGPNPTESLDYWIRSNEEAVRKGRALPTGQFMIVNYDELCAEPRVGVQHLIAFFGLDPPDRILQHVTSLPRRGGTRLGWPGDAATQFDEERLARVRALGFTMGGSE